MTAIFLLVLALFTMVRGPEDIFQADYIVIWLLIAAVTTFLDFVMGSRSDK